MGPKKSPRKGVDKKRARQSSSTEDEHHGASEDDLYLELFDLVRALESKDQVKSKLISDLQDQLNTASAEISALKTKVNDLESSLMFTQKQQEESSVRIDKCEDDQFRHEDELVRQSIYSRRWNLIFHGIPETEEENCPELVRDVLVSSLKIHESKAKSVMFCGVHRLGRKKPRKRSGNNRPNPRPIIARFTCRADRDLAWRQRFNLKESSIKIAEDLPLNVREVRKNILIPALKKARQNQGNKATIIGDRLLVNGKRYSFDKIPKKWQSNEGDGNLAERNEVPAPIQASHAEDGSQVQYELL